jgi:hypothetical protein
MLLLVRKKSYLGLEKMRLKPTGTLSQQYTVYNNEKNIKNGGKKNLPRADSEMCCLYVFVGGGSDVVL